jgi:hypothetical protein
MAVTRGLSGAGGGPGGQDCRHSRGWMRDGQATGGARGMTGAALGPRVELDA